METNGNGRLRILLNGLSARGGGTQTYLINLLHFLPEDAKIDIFVLAPDSLPLPTDRKNIQRIKVDWPVENPIVRALWEKIHLPKVLRKIGADVLFCPGGIIGASVPSGCKRVAMFRNMLPFDLVQRQKYPLGYMRVRHWLLEKILLRSMLRADLVIFISEFARKTIADLGHQRIKNTAVIPHGINPSFRNGTEKSSPRPDWLPAQDYLLYVSTVDFYKSHIEVIQAFALLKEKRSTKEKLVLVGPESAQYGPKVRAEIRRLGLEGDVVMAGHIPYDQMPELYHHATLKIFASQCENCPNILLEALAAGLPILASNCPPMPEFAGDAAIYFDPSSPTELAGQLMKLLADPNGMRELSAKAINRSSRYDWAQTAAATWKRIEEIAENP